MRKKIGRGKYIGKDISGRKIYFASQKNISEIYADCKDFIKRVFGIDVIFLSDESSLNDFTNSKKINKDIINKVRKIYNVNISSVKKKPIFEIVKFILDNKK